MSVIGPEYGLYWWRHPHGCPCEACRPRQRRVFTWYPSSCQRQVFTTWQRAMIFANKNGTPQHPARVTKEGSLWRVTYFRPAYIATWNHDHAV